MNKQTTLREKLDSLFDKHTVAFTKTTEGEAEIVSFDTVVLNAYEAKNDLESLFDSTLHELLGEKETKVVKVDNKELSEIANTIIRTRNELRDEILTKWERIKG
jgi:hypothetical protein